VHQIQEDVAGVDMRVVHHLVGEEVAGVEPLLREAMEADPAAPRR
jgi:hypothetical protein